MEIFSNFANNLKNILQNIDLHKMSLKDVLVCAGLLYTSGLTYTFLKSIVRTFNVFYLSKIWPRDFKKEYGEWASKYNII